MAVTPFVGVWIEILISTLCNMSLLVTPFVGVWIEILLYISGNFAGGSLPSWECGLKSDCKGYKTARCTVTPFVGVWIEIFALIGFSL